MVDFIYLASQSPRRSQLLSQIGVRHELLLPAIEEDAEALEAVMPGEAPITYVQRVTKLKLNAALLRLQTRGLPPAPVLCSDTTVALGNRIFGKPADGPDAHQMLQSLSGQTHRVLTAIAIGHAGTAWTALSESEVTFSAMTTSQIKDYVLTGEPIGKAGAYAVQGGAAAYISRICGSYTGIMGLPLFETAQLLAALD
jgi:septum formation protein